MRTSSRTFASEREVNGKTGRTTGCDPTRSNLSWSEKGAGTTKVPARELRTAGQLRKPELFGEPSLGGRNLVGADSTAPDSTAVLVQPTLVCERRDLEEVTDQFGP
jgi:hypothetical protein